eukprot:scaffold218066_cov35-Tisochrysis_lutea.AAC.1
MAVLRRLASGAGTRCTPRARPWPPCAMGLPGSVCRPATVRRARAVWHPGAVRRSRAVGFPRAVWLPAAKGSAAAKRAEDGVHRGSRHPSPFELRVVERAVVRVAERGVRLRDPLESLCSPRLVATVAVGVVPQRKQPVLAAQLVGSEVAAQPEHR